VAKEEKENGRANRQKEIGLIKKTVGDPRFKDKPKNIDLYKLPLTLQTK
jgi:hypothetical protein